MDYKTFVKLNGGKSNKFVAAAWRKRFGNAPATPGSDPVNPTAVPDAAPGTAPAFVPGDLDESGQSSLTNLQRRYEQLVGANGQKGDIDVSFETAMNNAAKARLTGLRQSAVNHAARGTIRSGLKEQDDAEVRNAAMEAELSAQNQRGRALSDANANYEEGKNRITTDSNARAFDQWVASNPTPAPQDTAPTAPPQPEKPQAPVQPKKPSMSYTDFVKLHGGKSTSALSSAWRKRFGS